MKVPVTRRVLREQADGTAILEVHVADPKDVLAILRMGPIGAALSLSLDAPESKPPPIRVAATGVSAGQVGPATMPGEVGRVRKLAGDPLFQLYATESTKTDAGQVQDALAFALAFAVNVCGAKAPADFEQPAVVARLIELETAFGAWVSARG